ncbi:FlgN protein [Halanaerobium congolense]|jgi:flagellar biosynthesis/type III secretory pathway chaperone|uniref:FlgN protein n=1 Tax=Halanaerobium congolense TaxID=54121 RepID=A0A1G6NL01_9FIRM|nr:MULTISPECIES: flagellar protein FlgN [Halanaerobium]KXS48330.1 MAG: FlgN family protein [Halanaerobium sp. T82-1]OEG62809.1 MAG: flagellar biosynthesis protein FlgN [Halanaerobium sp. MDAL1]PTX16471.1 FlgN protein [Halanaerobium congolense]PUU86942.1 MAG: FlgN family protein [Halanaerobium sp.]PUU89023.1 MAG: FlgN family protein [Halanaerobium sp.]
MQAELKEDLIRLLKEEKELYQELFAVAEEKNEALLENDTAALSEILAADQEVIEKIEAKEKERKEIIEKIKSEFNLKLEHDKYSDFIEELPADWEEDLKDIRQKIIELTDDFYSLNDQNQKLLNQALEVNTFSIESILKSIKENKNTYTKKDKEQKEQPRLLNKKV